MVRPEWPYAAACKQILSDESEGRSGARKFCRRSSIWPRHWFSGEGRRFNPDASHHALFPELPQRRLVRFLRTGGTVRSDAGSTTTTRMRGDMSGGLCGMWSLSPNRSCRVCVPGLSVISASVWPAPKWR